MILGQQPRARQANSVNDLVQRILDDAGRPGLLELGDDIADRVFVEDGREELVRGLVPGEVTVRTLRDIVAAGSEPYVSNRLVSGGSFGAGENIPASIAAPPVIVRELELSREQGARQKTPLLESPLAAKPAGR